MLKQKADYITDTNNNDGVAKAIKKFIFEEQLLFMDGSKKTHP